jgi:hypothetical protein
MIQINSLFPKKGRNCRKVRGFAIDVIRARVILERFSGDDQIRARDDGVATTILLLVSRMARLEMVTLVPGP